MWRLGPEDWACDAGDEKWQPSSRTTAKHLPLQPADLDPSGSDFERFQGVREAISAVKSVFLALTMWSK